MSLVLIFCRLQREKPDRTKNTDHSFYLSKVETCLLAAPTKSTGGIGSISSKGSEDSNNSNSDSSRRGSLRLDREGREMRIRQKRPLSFTASSPGSSSSDRVLLPTPANKSGRSEGPSGGATGLRTQDQQQNQQSLAPSISRQEGSLPSFHQGFHKSGADRGGGSRTRERSGASISAGTSAAPSTKRKGSKAVSPQRVLSICFLGRTITLDLWFADETEGALWQVPLGGRHGGLCQDDFQHDVTTWILFPLCLPELLSEFRRVDACILPFSLSWGVLS